MTDTINHVALVLDKSSSMTGHRKNLIEVADTLVRHLAKKSVEMNQETRVSIYLFSSDVECVVFDKDVLRLPSIADLYRTSGMTALVDATHLSVTDLEKTAQMYGDHAFLVYVLTDGVENISSTTPTVLLNKLNSLPENWTVAALVPDQRGIVLAANYGFPEFNVAIWEADNTVDGVAQAMTKITTATDSYMTSRSQGVRGTRTLFSTGADVLNKDAIKQAGLQELPPALYDIYKVPVETDIRPFVIVQRGKYTQGSAYYELTKTETIQANKGVIVVEKSTGKAFSGQHARSLVGLGTREVRVKPNSNPDYTLYVQSTSVNRKLHGGSNLLVLR